MQPKIRVLKCVRVACVTASVICYATTSKSRRFLWCDLGGVTELADALLGFIVLSTVLSRAACGNLFATVAGIMLVFSFPPLNAFFLPLSNMTVIIV